VEWSALQIVRPVNSQRAPAPETPPGILDRAIGGGRLAGMKRYSRWFSLTVIQQAIWPLLIAVFGAPQVDLEDTPLDWYLGRIAGPAIAALLAWLYYRSATRDTWRTAVRTLTAQSRIRWFPRLAGQIRYVLLGVPVVLALARIAVGPADEALKIILFGLANVAAFHLIQFAVAPLAFADRREGQQAAVLLFGVSWGLHDALMVGLTEDGSWLLAFGVGLVLGWIVAVSSLALRRWPGGALTAAAAHFLVVYLIFGFA
jgi:hypothetical protein